MREKPMVVWLCQPAIIHNTIGDYAHQKTRRRAAFIVFGITRKLKPPIVILR
ncbi:MAG: hypothetical protein JXB07_06410 [Anaerolineae bacterium]|nr:hypothetical protein [Anaerolineae bacterium]